MTSMVNSVDSPANNILLLLAFQPKCSSSYMFKLTEIENKYIPISVKKMSISKTKFKP